MSLSKEQKLIEDFPNLYRDWDVSEAAKCKMLVGSGFWCGEGWESLLRDVSAKLEAMLCALSAKDRKRIRAMMVKQEHGLLHLSIENSTKEMMQVVMDAEDSSGSICEECGKPGETRRSEPGGIRTHCDVCRLKFQQEQ